MDDQGWRSQTTNSCKVKKKKRNVDEDHPDGARETLPVDASAPSRTVQVDRFWTNGGDVLSKTFPKGSGTQEETLHNSFLDPYIYIYIDPYLACETVPSVAVRSKSSSSLTCGETWRSSRRRADRSGEVESRRVEARSHARGTGRLTKVRWVCDFEAAREGIPDYLDLF